MEAFRGSPDFCVPLAARAGTEPAVISQSSERTDMRGWRKSSTRQHRPRHGHCGHHPADAVDNTWAPPVPTAARTRRFRPAPAARTRIAAPAGPMAAPGMRTPRTPPARSSGRTVKLVRSTGIRSPVTGATRATDYGAAGARRVRERPRPPHRLAMITTTNSTSPRPGRLAEQVRQP